MANRQVRNPGQLARFDMSAAIGDAPSYAVNTGQAAEALANVAGNLSDALGKMAAEARVKEQAEAGLAYGQQAYDAFQRQTKAVSEASGIEAGMVRAPGDIRKLVSDAAIKHGVDPNAMLRIAMVESSFNPKAKNPSSSAGGLFQFIDSTAKQYGLADRYDPAQAADAAARLAKDNSAHLSKVLGRAPNAGELYLAHQQGAGGAAKLLANPGAKAVDIVGADAVRLNGGRADMTAGQFASLWMKKVGGSSVDDAPALSKTPLALRRDGTASGDAFDNAVLSAFAWRMQEGIATELSAAHLQFPDDPAGYAAAAKEVRDKYSKELPTDPKTRELFDKSFADKNNAFVRNISANYEKKLRDDQEVSYAGGISSMQIELERQAQVLGANPEGDTIIGQQTATIQRSIDGAVSQGIITREQGEKKKLEVAETAARGRIQGVYDALPTPDQKEAYATGILDEWRKREGPMAAMPFATVKALSNTLFSDARQLKAAQASANKAEQVRVKGLIEDDIASMGATGVGNTELSVAHVTETLGDEAATAWGQKRDQAQTVFQATSGMEGESLEEIEQRLTSLVPAPGQTGYADREKVYDAADKRADAILKERAKDPLGQASRAGLIALEPILTLTPETISQSLEQRAGQRKIVASAYGFVPPIFTPEETSALKAQMQSLDPAVQTAAMTQLDYLYGSDGALAVKQQLGDDAVSKVQDWQGRLRYMTPEEMTGWLKEKNDPRWQERVKPLVTKGETEAKKVSYDEIVSALDDGGIFSFSANPSADPDVRQLMMNDYVSLVGDRYASLGNIDAAKEQAIDRMKKVWGPSRAFGERGGRLMLYPPEAHYPAIENSHGYISSEIAGIAKARGVEPSSLSLVSDRKTEAAVDRGELPGYLLSTVNPKTGLSELVTDDKGRPLRHFFDPKAAQVSASEAAIEKRRTRNDPWLVLPGDAAIGPIYPFGASKADLADRARRIGEIRAGRSQRAEEMRKRRALLRSADIPGLPVPPEDQ